MPDSAVSEREQKVLRIIETARAKRPRFKDETVTMADGSTIQGTLVRKDDWLVILMLPDGTRKSMARTNGVPKVDVKDPKDPHKTMVLELDDPENKKMHDVTAYLSTIK